MGPDDTEIAVEAPSDVAGILRAAQQYIEQLVDVIDLLVDGRAIARADSAVSEMTSITDLALAIRERAAYGTTAVNVLRNRLGARV